MFFNTLDINNAKITRFKNTNKVLTLSSQELKVIDKAIFEGKKKFVLHFLMENKNTNLQAYDVTKKQFPGQ